MKSYLKAASVFVLIGFMLISCTKEQLALNLLQGEWGVTSVKVDGVDQDPDSYKDLVYVFEDCKDTDPECYGSIQDGTTGTDVSFRYTVGEDFNDFSIVYDGGIGDDWVYDVDEHSLDRVVISATDTSGTKTTTTLEKNN